MVYLVLFWEMLFLTSFFSFNAIIIIVLLLITLCSQVSSIPVENSVFGDIEMECDSRIISIQIKTENPFIGTIFVKDFSSERDCIAQGNGRLTSFLEVEIGRCGVVRQRTLNPRGTQVRVVVTISFHPQFITKVDRTYHLLCIYKEASTPTNSTLSVPDITTISIFHNLTMPTCTYQILSGGPNGTPVEFGVIGQQVYHKWQCESEHEDVFCMLVHSCSADDGRGERVSIMDSNGCALDRFLLSDIEYPGDLLAGQEAHIYKFPDRAALFFQCQITITIKEPDEECARPICVEGEGAPAYSVPESKQITKRAQIAKRETKQVLDVRARLAVGSEGLEHLEHPSEPDCILLSEFSISCILIYLLLVTSTFLMANFLACDKPT